MSKQNKEECIYKNALIKIFELSQSSKLENDKQRLKRVKNISAKALYKGTLKNYEHEKEK